MSIHRLVTATLALALIITAPAIAGTSFTFSMTGLQENPPVATDAFGKCVAILSGDESTLEVHCTHSVEETIGAHIHRGAPGVNGPVIFDLGDSSTPIQRTWSPTPDEVADLLVGNLYINVHSPTHPGGEIRGQMKPDHRMTEQLWAFPLEGEQETPPVATAFSGSCLATLDSDLELSLTCVHDIPETTAAHIHIGARGVPGGIDIDLGDGMSPIRHIVILSQAQVETLLAGNYYVNVHTAAYPAGELRGQMDGCIQDESTLCLNRGRFAVSIDWAAPPDSAFGSGEGIGTQLTDDSGTFWFFDPANVEIIVKVLNACVVPFNRFWVFHSGLTNVEYTLTVVDTETGEEQTYENSQGQVAQPVLDTDAFATCP